MLDLCTGSVRPAEPVRGAAGTFPIVAWRRGGADTWGVEAIMLSPGQRSSGSVTTSASSTRPVSPPRWPSPARTPRRVVRPRPARHGHTGVGLRRPGTLLGLTRGAAAQRSCVPSSRAWPIAARTCSRRPSPTSGFSSKRCASTADVGEPGLRPGTRNAVGRPVELAPFSRRRPWGRDSWGIATGTWRDEDDVAAAYRPPPSSSPTRTTPPASMTGNGGSTPAARREDDPRALGHQLLTPPPPPAAPAGGVASPNGACCARLRGGERSMADCCGSSGTQRRAGAPR